MPRMIGVGQSAKLRFPLGQFFHQPFAFSWRFSALADIAHDDLNGRSLSPLTQGRDNFHIEESFIQAHPDLFDRRSAFLLRST